MFSVNERIHIPDDELHWSYVRAGGPGGQNVNKVASKAVLRWDVGRTPSLPPEVKARFLAQQPTRITTEGEIVIQSQRFRDQDRNRQDCLDKLRELILLATVVPKVRKKTRRTRGSQERRLEAKRRRASVKGGRRSPSAE
jgi:ribosome-associated protein